MRARPGTRALLWNCYDVDIDCPNVACQCYGPGHSSGDIPCPTVGAPDCFSLEENSFGSTKVCQQKTGISFLSGVQFPSIVMTVREVTCTQSTFYDEKDAVLFSTETCLGTVGYFGGTTTYCRISFDDQDCDYCEKDASSYCNSPNDDKQDYDIRYTFDCRNINGGRKDVSCSALPFPILEVGGAVSKEPSGAPSRVYNV